MTHLRRHLEQTGIVPLDRLEAAIRRQQIYGGSLDTVLLEQELVTPAELQGLLASATRLNAAPEHLLRPRHDRPWDVVPDSLAGSGWALPLAVEGERTFVAVHPEIPGDRLEALRESVPGLVPLVTPECVMVRLTAERAGSVIPQRYAVLSVRFLEALAGAPPRRHEAAVAHRSPTMTIEARDSVQIRPPERRVPSAPVRPGPVEIGPTSDRQVSASAPAFVEPTPASRAPTMAPPRDTGPREPEVDDAVLSEIVATGRHALERCDERDAVTAVLATATLRLCPRVALFAVKKGELRALPVPGGELASIEGARAPVAAGSDLERIVTGEEHPAEMVEPTLRVTVGLVQPVPCITHPVSVRGRSVLLLYADRAGAPFAGTERTAVQTLAEEAGRALEQVVLRRRARAKDLAPQPATSPPSPAVPDIETTLPSLVAASPAMHSGPTIVPGGTSDPFAAPPVRPRPAPGPPSVERPVPDEAAPEETLTGVPTESVTGGAAARPGPRPGEEVIQLTTPVTPQTSRGRIELDDEDRVQAQPQPIDSLEQRADRALDRVAAREVASLAELLELGEAGLMRLSARFPGPLEVFRRDLNSLPPPSAHGPLVRAALKIGRDMTPHLIELMDHPNPDVRFYAAFVFQELRDERCVKPLGELAFDASGDVRVIAMRVLETYSRTAPFPGAVSRVRIGLSAANRGRQLQAGRAVGTLRDHGSIPRLIELLSSKDQYIQEAALESLCSITGQQHGLKPHRWRAWYDEHEHEHRVEWIIDSLQHRDVAVRRWASDELSRVTGHRVSASPAGDRKEQAACVQEWRDWWNAVGREAFTRPA